MLSHLVSRWPFPAEFIQHSSRENLTSSSPSHASLCQCFISRRERFARSYPSKTVRRGVILSPGSSVAGRRPFLGSSSIGSGTLGKLRESYDSVHSGAGLWNSLSPPCPECRVASQHLVTGALGERLWNAGSTQCLSSFLNGVKLVHYSPSRAAKSANGLRLTNVGGCLSRGFPISQAIGVQGYAQQQTIRNRRRQGSARSLRNGIRPAALNGSTEAEVGPATKSAAGRVPGQEGPLADKAGNKPADLPCESLPAGPVRIVPAGTHLEAEPISSNHRNNEKAEENPGPGSLAGRQALPGQRQEEGLAGDPGRIREGAGKFLGNSTKSGSLAAQGSRSAPIYEYEGIQHSPILATRPSYEGFKVQGQDREPMDGLPAAAGGESRTQSPEAGPGTHSKGPREAIAEAPATDQWQIVEVPGGELRKAWEEEHRRQARRVFRSYLLQEAQDDLHLWAASWLRAESYCEDQPYVRYVESFKKRFAEQEFNSLKRRVVAKCGRSLKCTCFVAVALPPEGWDDSGGPHGNAVQTTLGTLDVSLRQLAPGEVMPGVQVTAGSPLPWQGLLRRLAPGPANREAPSGAAWKPQKYGYIANVCVKKGARRRGIAYSLLQVALEAAAEWGLKEVYCHVDVGNRAAYTLYQQSGFEVVSGEEVHDASTDAVRPPLDQPILLKISL